MNAGRLNYPVWRIAVGMTLYTGRIDRPTWIHQRNLDQLAPLHSDYNSMAGGAPGCVSSTPSSPNKQVAKAIAYSIKALNGTLSFASSTMGSRA